MSLSSRNWFRGLAATSAAVVFAVAGGAAAQADDISNNLDSSIDAVAENMALTVGGTSGTTTLFVNPTGTGPTPSDGKSGCNLTGSTTISANVESSNAGVATVSPSTVTFTSCSDTKVLTVTPVAAGTANITLSQTSNNSGGTFDLAPATFTVAVTATTKTPTTTTVTCPAHVTYTGDAQTPCSAITTAGGIPLMSPPVVWDYASNTNAGMATVTATYPGTSTYASSSDDEVFTIDKADALCTVHGSTTVYDGNAHGATGSCIGVNNETLEGLDLGASFTDVPGGTANWTFTPVSGNYNSKNGTAAIEITKASPTCDVNGVTGVYDGDAHGATGSCIGVKNEALTGDLNLGASFTDVPGGTANWTFSNLNYKDQQGTAAIVINAWTLKGFYAPVDMNGVWNTVKNGSTVPLKFELFAGSTELTSTSAVKSFTQAKITCGSGNEDAVEETVASTGGTSLRYDNTGGQYIQNWQTPKLANTCYRVTMTAQDGSILSALFKLK